MSRRAITQAIETVLGNERLRIRLVFERIDSLADLGAFGVQLTADELDLFVQADPRVWFFARSILGDRMH
jgi:hypothetical protein